MEGTTYWSLRLKRFRDINDYNKLPTYLAAEIVTQSRKEVLLDLVTVTSSYAVATRPDFDVKNGTKGILFNRVFNSIQADIIIAASGKELFLSFRMVPFICILLCPGR